MPSLTNTRYTALLEAESKLKELRESNALQPFVQRFAEFLAVCAANKSIHSWDETTKNCFAAAAREMPTLARLYTERNIEMFK